jgi:glycine/D-amino acid oxidase-like deaminating enzyme
LDADVLIIGGGIAGVSAAAALSGAASVALVEAEPVLAHHASGRSAALYEPRYGAPPVVALSLASGPALHAAGVLSPRGLMLLAAPGEEAAFAADAAGMALDEIGVAEALARVPVLNPAAIARVAVAEHAWDIDTDRLIQGHVRLARSRGAAILTGHPVTAMVRDGPGWLVTAGPLRLQVRVVVNAAGAWAGPVAAMAGVAPLGIVPHRRSMARIPAPGGHDPGRWPMLMGAGETWYAKPDAGALIVSPADEDPAPPHDAWADDLVLAEGLARYEGFVTEPVTRVLANWAGLRSFAPDRVPVIGFDVAVPGFFWLAGQGGYGFQSSAAAAGLAADLILGRAPDLGAGLAGQLSPRRFVRAAGLTPAVPTP